MSTETARDRFVAVLSLNTKELEDAAEDREKFWDLMTERVIPKLDRLEVLLRAQAEAQSQERRDRKTWADVARDPVIRGAVGAALTLAVNLLAFWALGMTPPVPMPTIPAAQHGSADVTP